ncbi:MAG TPA: Calx-beta domain-containing protein [Candidatus Dormibacteraeota bacterium]|nr:Calx-beta domain-containing protein [Candidatus Dormibacteraeota bacterium]
MAVLNPRHSQFLPLALGIALSAAQLLSSSPALAESESGEKVRLVLPAKGRATDARRINAAGQAVVNFGEMSRREELLGPRKGEIRAKVMEELEEPEEPFSPYAPPSIELSPLRPGSIQSPSGIQVVSPSPTQSFMGLDDIAMVDSLYIVIPPDCGGAVGLTKVMSGLNNNYRVFNKADGSVVSTVGTATFWAPSGETALNGLTDPRTLYDPYNNRWIAVMQTVGLSGDILLGVSQTSDPNGAWFLYRFAIGFQIDFPIVGFNKNWISISINRYSNAGLFQRGINLVVDYGQARAGVGTGILFTLATNTHFCSAPTATYSATEDTLFVITHLTSTGPTYSVDLITGTPSVPVYTSGAALTRPGGAWAQPTLPNSQVLPQSAPNSGTSACSPPCVIETQDSQVRSAPVYRGGSLYYTQTIGLPAVTLSHTAVQWTKLNATGGAFQDGGRIEDPTATATNGGKWYAFPHIANNSVGDFIVGYSQFSSAQHPSAGYSMHLNGDAAGSLRDPLIYKAGEDYYHKDFGSGRNRWGDFSQAQVDPSDDKTLWVVQEYGKNRTGTNDGTTGANSSRWSTYWASVAGVPTVTLAPGPSLSEGNAGNTAFQFTVNFSNPPPLPMTVNYQTSDGTATVADNDYQSATGTLAVPPGTPSGLITINVIGDTKVEPNETFTLTLTGAANGVIGSPNTATGTILNDDTYTITASAGANGSISPSGAVSVPPGGTQAFTITPNACYHVADVLVDGVSAGAVTSFTFSSVAASHTIAASFAIDTFVITASAGSGGSIAPSGPVAVNCGASQAFTITPDASHTISDVLVDGASVGTVAAFTFTNVTAAHTISATFAAASFIITASAGTGGTISPSGAVSVPSGQDQMFTIAPGPCYHVDDVLVDGSSVGAMTAYTFPAVSANHSIAAAFAPDRLLSIGDVIAYEGNTGTTDFDFPVRLSGPCSEEVDVIWKTVDGTATASSGDFVADSTALALAPGATSGTITVRVNGDLTPEDHETFLVDLLSPVNAGIQDGEGSGTILNDDGITAAEGLSIRDVSLAIRGNPVGDAVSFRLGLPTSTRVELSIFDIAGRRVAQPLNTSLDRGYHTVTWNPRRDSGALGSGVYFVRFQAQGRTVERRFVVLR